MLVIIYNMVILIYGSARHVYEFPSSRFAPSLVEVCLYKDVFIWIWVFLNIHLVCIFFKGEYTAERNKTKNTNSDREYKENSIRCLLNDMAKRSLC